MKTKPNWLAIVNFVLFQWFFVRLTKCQKKVVKEFNIKAYSIMNDGSMSTMGTGKVERTQWYSIQGWIVPFTGWKNGFKTIGEKPFFYRITKPKVLGMPVYENPPKPPKKKV